MTHIFEARDRNETITESNKKLYQVCYYLLNYKLTVNSTKAINIQRQMKN